MKRWLIRFMDCLMLVAYIAYFAGSNFFIHKHQMQFNVVVHSHPFTNPNHGHSEHDLVLLDLLQECTTTEAVHFELPQCAMQLCFAVQSVAPQQKPVVAVRWSEQLRAPPAA